MTDPVTSHPEEVIDPTTEETEATATAETEDVEAAPEAVDTGLVDAAFAQQFRYPTSVETSQDGSHIVYLQPNEDGELELWTCETTEAAVPQRIDLPFTPVEDRDPDTGRLIRGPQFSPETTHIAVTGTHPDGDRTAIWIVPFAAPAQQEAVVEADAEPIAAADTDEFDLEVADDDGMAVPPADGIEGEAEGDDLPQAEVAAEEPVEPSELFASTTAAEVSTDPVDEIDLITADDDGMPPLVDDEAPTDLADETDVQQDDADLSMEAIQESLDDSGSDEVDTSKPFMLAKHAGSDRSPRWSPDSQIIAFVSTIDGHDVIALGSPEEPGGIEMLTWSREHSREPQWARDGKFLAFLRPIPGGEGFHDIWSFSLEAGELTNLTGEKAAAVRHSIEWVPGRNLIAYVTVENDWLGISVVNADNKAGWVVTRESGDKTEPRFAQDEARLVYLRNEGFTTVLCERSLHSSAAVALDPGEGVASYGRWAGPKRVAYAFSAPMKPFGFFVQESKAKADRVALQPEVGGSTRDMPLVQPQPLEFEVGPEETFSGLEYRSEDVSTERPGAVYLPDGALATRRGAFQMEEQALASTGLAVFSPVIHGASGFGAAIESDLREYADSELEATDIAEAAAVLGRQSNVKADAISLVGHGFGGALALVAAGARPGSFGSVVVIDPVVDWSTEIANADVAWRNWITDRFGMPFTHADTYALRTPATFSAVIDVPLYLVTTANAPEHRVAQFRALTADLDEMGVAYTVIEAPAEPLTATLRRVGRELMDSFTPAVSEVLGDTAERHDEV